MEFARCRETEGAIGLDLQAEILAGRAKKLATNWWIVRGIAGTATISVRMTDDPTSPQIASLELGMTDMMEVANFVLTIE